MKSVRMVLSSISAATVVAFLRVSTSAAQMDSLRSGIQAAIGPGEQLDLFGNGAIFTTIVQTMLFVVGAVAVIMLIYGGFRYVISGGNSANVTAAKNTILYAIVGVIVALLAYAIIDFVLDTVGGMGSTSGL